MFLLSKPDDQTIQSFLDARHHDNFSYSEIGASRASGAPAGYNVDHNRIQLGSGISDFTKAIAAIQSWQMFAMPWVRLYRSDAPIEVGRTVVALIEHLGFYSLNASRVVYVVEEKGQIERYGFAYGTLTEHGEQGEERFIVEFHHASNEVWYDLYAFSKPKHFLAKIGYPFSRALQKQFAIESKRSMLRAVKS